MKLIIASDIHGSAYWCRKLEQMMEQEQPDKLILLGDLLYFLSGGKINPLIGSAGVSALTICRPCPRGAYFSPATPM